MNESLNHGFITCQTLKKPRNFLSTFFVDFQPDFSESKYFWISHYPLNVKPNFSVHKLTKNDPNP